MSREIVKLHEGEKIMSQTGKKCLNHHKVIVSLLPSEHIRSQLFHLYSSFSLAGLSVYLKKEKVDEKACLDEKKAKRESPFNCDLVSICMCRC